MTIKPFKPSLRHDNIGVTMNANVNAVAEPQPSCREDAYADSSALANVSCLRQPCDGAKRVLELGTLASYGGERSSVGRASVCGTEGRGFKSHRSPQPILTRLSRTRSVQENLTAFGIGRRHRDHRGLVARNTLRGDLDRRTSTERPCGIPTVGTSRIAPSICEPPDCSNAIEDRVPDSFCRP
jgi:hypothetical protein